MENFKCNEKLSNIEYIIIKSSKSKNISFSNFSKNYKIAS